MKGVRAYREVLRLVRRLPNETRGYYAKYARENFVNYRDATDADAGELEEVFRRAYNQSVWVLDKYSVDRKWADKLEAICRDKAGDADR